jgi:hypothetical protein
MTGGWDGPPPTYTSISVGGKEPNNWKIRNTRAMKN